MSKKIRHVTQALSNGYSITMARYLNINKKGAKRLIDHTWKKLGKPLIVKGDTSLAIPSHGMEIIRTGYRSLVVCQLTGGYGDVVNPTISQLLQGGFTHFYNEYFDKWVSLKEAEEDNDAYDKREAERAAFNADEDAKYHQDINTPEV